LIFLTHTTCKHRLGCFYLREKLLLIIDEGILENHQNRPFDKSSMKIAANKLTLADFHWELPEQ
jgi:hypothetical protein